MIRLIPTERPLSTDRESAHRGQARSGRRSTGTPNQNALPSGRTDPDRQAGGGPRREERPSVTEEQNQRGVQKEVILKEAFCPGSIAPAIPRNTVPIRVDHAGELRDAATPEDRDPQVE